MCLRISIALATYNGAKYLSDQLISFINQTHLPDELIICDDCSTDDTLVIAHNFAQSAPFQVKIFSNERNIGYAQNFSRALGLCSGDIVFLSDQDDVWDRDKISIILAKFVADPSVQLLIHDIYFCKEDLTSIGQTKIERMSALFNLQQHYIVGMATAVRGPFLRLCLPVPDGRGLSHDSWLHQCAVAVAGKGIVNNVLALHRRHDSNVTLTNKLNADFIITSAHLKADLFKALRLFLAKREIGEPEPTPVTKWLKENRKLLVDQSYATDLQIEKLLYEDVCRISCIKSRLNIVSMSRLKRIWPIIMFYRNGGYRYFVGWKSAMKDLFVR